MGEGPQRRGEERGGEEGKREERRGERIPKGGDRVRCEAQGLTGARASVLDAASDSGCELGRYTGKVRGCPMLCSDCCAEADAQVGGPTWGEADARLARSHRHCTGGKPWVSWYRQKVQVHEQVQVLLAFVQRWYKYRTENSGWNSGSPALHGHMQTAASRCACARA